jgi:rhamnulokinase
MAAKAPPFSAVIDPDDPAFLTPGEMPAKIEGFCERSGQDAPRGKGAIIRTALESLALKYRFVLERLEAVVGRRLAPLHIVGGGTQNELLSQMTADATGKTVVAGPVEATAIGNILMQLLAYGEIDGLPAGRALVRRSFETKTFHPVDHGTWNRTYEQHREIIAGRSRLNPPGS